MFIGHGAVAFAIAAGLAVHRGWDADRALAIGLLAGAFATVPDVDIAYALVGVASVASLNADALAVASTFWATGNLVHRAVTHSLVLAPPVALLAALRVGNGRARTLAVVPALAVVAVVAVASGPLGVAVSVLFVLVAAAVAEAARRHTDFTPRQTFAAALLGLASHPFGDLLTGHPPAMLYPLEAAVVSERVALAPDPTLHLLGAFGVELAAIWAAALVYCAVVGLRPTAAVRPLAALGAGYAAGIAFIPAPTLDLSYPFVFSVLGFAFLGFVPRVRMAGVRQRPAVQTPDRVSALLTGLSAVTVAWLAYAVVYVRV